MDPDVTIEVFEQRDGSSIVRYGHWHGLAVAEPDMLRAIEVLRKTFVRIGMTANGRFHNLGPITQKERSKYSMAKTMKKKAGDGYPTDLTGQVLYVGSIVTVPHITLANDFSMRLAVIKKLFKNGRADVQIFLSEKVQEHGRIDKAAEIVTLVDPSKLNPRNSLFEAIKMYVKEAEYKDLQ